MIRTYSPPRHLLDVLVCRRLQSSVDAVVQWCKWRFQINSTNSEAMRFSKKRNLFPTTIKGERLPWRSQVRYLGVIFHVKLIFCQHFTYTYVTTKLVRGRSALCTVFLWPILTYDDLILSSANVTQILLTKQSVRIILRAP